MEPLAQRDFFAEPYLRELFLARIARSRAVGMDGVRIGTFQRALETELKLISRKVLAQTYRFTPFKERLVLRGSKRPPRQLSIPTIRDRLTLRAACNALGQLVPSAQTEPPHTYIKAIARLIRAGTEHLSFVRVDVKDFFPTIRHDRLIGLVRDRGAEPFLGNLIKSAIATPTGSSGSDAGDRILGVPQGLSISSILSSLYMLELDGNQEDGGYFRYVDDILIVCPSHKASRRFKDIDAALRKIGLEPHQIDTSGKSEIRRIGEGIEYLGYHITPKKISIRSSSYRKMFLNLLRVITNFRYKGDDDKFIFRLNLKISGCIIDGKRRGWLMFFSQTEDVSQLKFLDKFISRQLIRIGALKHETAVKKFVKAYHEIRYKGENSSYIPNFDAFDFDQRVAVVAKLKGVSVEEIYRMTSEEIEIEFQRLLAKEIADLEKDVIGVIS
jgi:retron-type reverse transcriptase